MRSQTDKSLLPRLNWGGDQHDPERMFVYYDTETHQPVPGVHRLVTHSLREFDRLHPCERMVTELKARVRQQLEGSLSTMQHGVDMREGACLTEERAVDISTVDVYTRALGVDPMYVHRLTYGPCWNFRSEQLKLRRQMLVLGLSQHQPHCAPSCAAPHPQTWALEMVRLTIDV